MKKALLLLALSIAVAMSVDAQTTPKRGHLNRQTNSSTSGTKKSVKDVKPSNTTFAFLVGWDGLGDNIFNGLSSTNDAYGTKPWFNSWQLELGYKVYKVDKFACSVGVGYESDVYKFDNDNGGFVYLDRNDLSGTPTMKVKSGLELAAEGKETNGWESRLCTRYVTIPLGVDYAVSEEFGVGLTLLPGFNFTTKHTGLKYNLHGDNQSYLRDNLKGYISPFKFDIRFNVNFSIVSLFLQMSPVSVFKDTDREDVHPLRFGFMIKM